MLREQLWFDFCDDLPIEIEQRIDEGILEAERFKAVSYTHLTLPTKA